MARDRKRAKQRRDRTRRAASATAERRPRRREEDETRGAVASSGAVEAGTGADALESDPAPDPELAPDAPAPDADALDAAAPDADGSDAEPDALEPDATLDDPRAALSRAEADDTHEAPDALDHASAEVDIANAQLALGRARAGDDEPMGADEEELTGGEVGLADDDIEESASSGAGRRGSTRQALEPAAARTRGVAQSDPAGNKVTSFLRASWRELQRVQWPDRRQVTQATAVVVAFVVVAGLYLGLADVVFTKLVDLIL